MNKYIIILDKDYAQWVKEFGIRYRHSQLKDALIADVEEEAKLSEIENRK